MSLYPTASYHRSTFLRCLLVEEASVACTVWSIPKKKLCWQHYRQPLPPASSPPLNNMAHYPTLTYSTFKVQANGLPPELRVLPPLDVSTRGREDANRFFLECLSR